MYIYMNTYLYKYRCPRWWGYVSGLRNLNSDDFESEEKVVKRATNYENQISGSKSCSIALLQQYKVSIENIKNYSALTSIPMNISVNGTVDKSSDNIIKEFK